MGPAQVNGYYDPQQNRIGMWEFPVRAFYSLYRFPRSFKIKMSNIKQNSTQLDSSLV